jgi:hypothetical protein
VALELTDAVTYYERTMGTATPTYVPCPYDKSLGIVDCSAAGYGKIALDPVPSDSDVWNCKVLLTPAGVVVVASCLSTLAPVPAARIYEVLEP